MNGTWGSSLGLTIYGESHGNGLGVVINNLPPGIKLDLDAIKKEMDRRKPGTSKLATPRSEADAFEILSGFFEDHTTGAPLAIVIRNTNQRSRDYSKVKDVLRPGHADWTAFKKYRGFQDYRGGGHFSGRLTAGLVFAGAVAQQVLKTENIEVGALIKSIGPIKSSMISLEDLLNASFEGWKSSSLPVMEDTKKDQMIAFIDQTRESHDSVGGQIYVAAKGLPPGLGQPFFHSMESRIAHIMFSVPAVKGIEFGKGFEITEMYGHEANDPIYLEGDEICSKTNNNGGILGGITNGMPLEVTVAIKPTPSIGQLQETVNIKTGEKINHAVEGRHDPCILPRAVPVIESVLAIAILDAMMDEGYKFHVDK